MMEIRDFPKINLFKARKMSYNECIIINCAGLKGDRNGRDYYEKYFICVFGMRSIH